MCEEMYGNEAAFKIQQKVLADDAISDSAKLTFCRLNSCYDSFRLGWLVYDPVWNEDAWKSIYELEAKGYVYMKDSKDKKDKVVGLIPLNMKFN
jgi:hypothetical protein